MGWDVSAHPECTGVLCSDGDATNVDRSPILFIDASGRIFMVLVGRPSGAKDWDDLCRRAVNVMVEEGGKYTPEGKPNERRGPHPNASGGYSFGGGQTVREPCCHGRTQADNVNSVSVTSRIRHETLR